MKILKMALAAACALASTAAPAAVVNAQTKAPNTSHCHYEGTVIMEDGAYDVYYCHYVGDGWY
jgi:opacity protein-like surface antigen